MINNLKADLHIHTNNSDGKYSFEYIKNVIENAKYIKIASITDHHYLTIQKNFESNGILWLPGIEISAISNGKSVHITGYSLNPKISTDLNKILQSIIDGYTHRANKIYSKIINLGYKLPELNSFRDSSLPPPIYKTDFIKQLGLISGLSNSREIRNWAKNNGKLLYIEEDNFFPDISVLIPAMQKSNFKTFWAHPGKNLFRNEEENKISTKTMQNIIGAGIDGIEVYAQKHNQNQIDFFLKQAKKYNLLVSGGSDYHGEEDEIISGFEGNEHTQLFLKSLGYK